MNSKECLENIKHAPGFMGGHSRYKSALESRIPFLEDIEIIKQDLDRLEKLEKENKELRKSIKSWNENVGNLLKENTKLKKAIEILKDSLELTLYHNKTLKIYSVELMCFEEHLGMEVTQEEYELLKEVVGNER